VFLLNEESLLERLSMVEEISRGHVAWSETAGLRQIFFRTDPREMDLVKLVSGAYSKRRRAAA
jgi:hypothetical protein